MANSRTLAASQRGTCRLRSSPTHPPLLCVAALCLLGLAIALPASSLADSVEAGQRRGRGSRAAQVARPPRISDILIDQFNSLIWHPQDNYFLSPSRVRVTMRDQTTGQEVVLNADDAEARPLLDAAGQPTGDMAITVKGNVTLTRSEGVLTGQGLNYNTQTQIGHLSNAHGVVSGQQARLDVTARSLDVAPDPKHPTLQVLTATDTAFTTCTLTHTDWHITARHARITSNGRVVARDITFWLGPTRIISLPSLTKTFGHTVSNPIPLPSYRKQTGIAMRFGNEVISTPATSLDYDISVSLLKTPQGTVSYEHDLGKPAADAAPPRTRLRAAAEPQPSILAASPALLRSPGDPDFTARRSTVYGLLTATTYVYNRTRSDLRVSRLPEVGISLRNLLNRPNPYGSDGHQVPPTESAFGPALFSPARWLLDAEASAGYYRESPTGRETSRVGLRADAASPLFRIGGPLYLRYGGSAWANGYGTGDGYLLLVPEAEVDLLVGRGTLFGAAYRYQHAYGSTPFFFDRRDVVHEMRLRYGFLGGRWAWDLAVSYDMQRGRAYDTLGSIRRRFDCMEIGVGYSARSQSVNLILNLLPGQPAPGSGAVSPPSAPH